MAEAAGGTSLQASSSQGGSGISDTPAEVEKQDMSAERVEEGEDEEEQVCRICRSEGSADAPLYYPCMCSGSIRYVHQECLMQWLVHSNTRSCEVCKHAFAFTPVYAENVPVSLSAWEFAFGLAMRGKRALSFLYRLFVVVIVWLSVPLSTCWMLRLCFSRSVAQVSAVVFTRVTLQMLVTDCIYGSVLSAVFVFVFFAALSLREIYLQQAEWGGNPAGQNQLAGDLDIPLAGLEEPRAAPVEREEPGPVFAGIPNWADEGAELDVVGWEDEEGAGRGGGAGAGPQAPPEPHRHHAPDLPAFAPPEPHRHHAPDLPAPAPGPPPLEAALRLPPRPLPPAMQLRNAPPEGARAHGGGAEGGGGPGHLDGGPLDDADAALLEEIPFHELIGMRGPVLGLLENAFTVLLCNSVFLVLSAWLPFTLGRVCCMWLATLSQLRVVVATTAAARHVAAFIQALCARPRLSTVGNTTWHSSSGTPADVAVGEDGYAGWSFLASMEASTAEGMCMAWERECSLEDAVVLQGLEAGRQLVGGQGPGLSDMAIVAVGYGTLLGIGLMWLLCIDLLRYLTGYSANTAAALLMNNLPPLTRQVAASMRYCGTLMKVMVLLLVELGLFPCMCGVWLDLCTLGLVGGRVSSRIAFWQSSPLVSTSLHWLGGMVYMLHMSRAISTLREVLRPGVLAFFRDPRDPNFNPLRELVEENIFKHVRRVAISACVYANVTVLLAYAPAKLALALAPASFPLDIQLAGPVMEILISILTCNVLLTLHFEQTNTLSIVRFALYQWIASVGSAVGLDDYLMPVIEGGLHGGPTRQLPVVIELDFGAAAPPQGGAAEAGGGSGEGGPAGAEGADAAGERRRVRCIRARVPIGLRRSTLYGWVSRHTGLPREQLHLVQKSPLAYLAESDAGGPRQPAHVHFAARAAANPPAGPHGHAWMLWGQAEGEGRAAAGGEGDARAGAQPGQQAGGQNRDRYTIRFRVDGEMPEGRGGLRGDGEDEELLWWIDEEDVPPVRGGDGEMAQGRDARVDGWAQDAAAQEEGNAGESDAYHHEIQEGGEDDAASARGSWFGLRMASLLFLAWVSMLGVHTMSCIVPVAIGRRLLHLAPLPVLHDVNAFGIGYYIVWGIALCVRYVVLHMRASGKDRTARQYRTACLSALKCGVIISLWLGIIPALLGRLLQLTLVLPLWLAVEKTSFLLSVYKDWALGLMGLQLWHKVVTLGGPLDHSVWKRRFERMRREGLCNVDMIWVLQEVILPLLLPLIMWLAFPYLVTCVGLPLVGVPHQLVMVFFRCSYPVGALAVLISEGMAAISAWFAALHNSIRDDRYLVGQHLNNYDHAVLPGAADPASHLHRAKVE